MMYCHFHQCPILFQFTPLQRI